MHAEIEILDENDFAIYISCPAHPLNLLGRNAVDSCSEAANLFRTVQLIYNFFSASTNRMKILKGCLVIETLVKCLSEKRWEAHAVATETILKSHPQIIVALDMFTRRPVTKEKQEL